MIDGVGVMDHPAEVAQGGCMTNQLHTSPLPTSLSADTTADLTTDSTAAARPGQAPQPDVDLRDVLRVLRRRSFAVVSTVSPAGFPHAAGVVYDAVDTTLYVHTMRSSRKARNVAAEPRVGVVVPFRRVPFGPPFNVQFQGHAAVLDMDTTEIAELRGAGRLSTIDQHDAFDEPDGCVLRIRPAGRLLTYGIGVSVLAVARDPLHVGAGSVDLPDVIGA
jgi:Pyridoxamine 5'-phosphate oxidase